jgi:DNA-binding transcriptional LysR family regulator
VHFYRRGDTRPVVKSVLGALRRAARTEGFGASREPDSGVKVIPVMQRSYASRLELRHLRYFVAAIEHETIGRAADHLEITQPALSRQLRDLEEEIGVSLLNRNTRGVLPTLAGESLYSDAVRILTAASQMALEASRAIRGTAGHCMVGVAASPLVWDTITTAIADLAHRLPDVDVAVEDVPTPKQAPAIREARLDLGIGHRFPTFSDLDQSIARVPLLPDRFNTALVSVNHPLARRPIVTLKDLEELPFLFMQRAFSPAFYDLVFSTFARAGFGPRIEGEHDGLPTVWALAAQGLGWCLGSASQRDYPPHGVVAVPIRDFDLPWGVELTYRRDEARPAVLEVIRSIEEAAHAIVSASMASQETKYWPQMALTG